MEEATKPTEPAIEARDREIAKHAAVQMEKFICAGTKGAAADLELHAAMIPVHLANLAPS
jgi:hypothetical protein